MKIQNIISKSYEMTTKGTVMEIFCCLVHVTSSSLRPFGLQPAKLLCPWNCPLNSPGKNTGVGSHFLLQEIIPTQGSNPHLLNGQADSLLRSHQGSSCITRRIKRETNFFKLMSDTRPSRTLENTKKDKCQKKKKEKLK